MVDNDGDNMDDEDTERKQGSLGGWEGEWGLEEIQEQQQEYWRVGRVVVGGGQDCDRGAQAN